MNSEIHHTDNLRVWGLKKLATPVQLMQVMPLEPNVAEMSKAPREVAWKRS